MKVLEKKFVVLEKTTQGCLEVFWAMGSGVEKKIKKLSNKSWKKFVKK